MTVVTLLDLPTTQTAAERLAADHLRANRAALLANQPDLADVLANPANPSEWVFGRDGSLTARDVNNHWWSGFSLPHAAAGAMLAKMEMKSPVACFLVPPHPAFLKIALAKLLPEQAVIAALPEEDDLRLTLNCENLTDEITSHRLWFVAGQYWAEMMESLLTHERGLAVPGQFLRMHSSDENLIQRLIQQATAVFSRLTIERSNLAAKLVDGHTVDSRTLCAMTPMRFSLWDTEGTTLAAAVADDRTRCIDTSDPAQSSPLRLAACACECGALLTPNLVRADLPGVIPQSIPWLSWITQNRIPTFEHAGPGDHLLVAGASIRAAALATGWPKERVHLAGWPEVSVPPPEQERLITVIADTFSVQTPADLEGFSSHRVLWETLRAELADDPFALDVDPSEFLQARMKRFDVSAEGFPHDRFVQQLIIPSYQQGVVRALVRANLKLQLHGAGWSEIEEFQPHATGPVGSTAQMNRIIADSAILAHLWPWRASHPICAIPRAIIRREGRNLNIFVQSAKRTADGRTSQVADGIPPISRELVACILSRIANA